MATQLAIVKIEGKLYYRDDRLREYRGRTDFKNRIPFDEIGNRKVEPVHPVKVINPVERKFN